MEWYSWVVAVILLISSVVSPWLVNKENNKHQLNLKKLDMYEEAKRKALENFINCCSCFYINNSSEELANLHTSINCLYIYFKDIPSYINDLEKYQNNNSFFSEVNDVVQELSKQIPKE